MKNKPKIKVTKNGPYVVTVNPSSNLFATAITSVNVTSEVTLTG